MASEHTGWRPLQQPRRAPAPPTSLDPRLSASPFVRLGRVHVLSLAGDTFVTVALAGSLFFDISPSAARERIALSLILTMAPFAVVAPFLGPFIDSRRAGRRTTALVAGGGRAVLAMVAAEAVQSLALFPLVFCLLVLSKAHGVAKASLVRGVVDEPGELVRANSRLAVLAGFAGFAAAVPAGLVLKLPFLGPGWVLRCAAVLFGATALAATQLIERPPPIEELVVPPTTEEAGLADDVADDLLGTPPVRTVLDRRLVALGLLRAATSMAVLRGIVGFLAFHVAFAFRRDGAPAWWLGVALGASALGSLLGSIVTPRVRALVPEEAIVLGSLGVVAVFAFVAFFREGRATASMCALSVGLAASSARLAFDSLVQRDSAASRQGRAFARFEAAFQLVWVVGALVPVALSIPLRWGGFVVSCIAAGGAAFYAAELWAFRQIRAGRQSLT